MKTIIRILLLAFCIFGSQVVVQAACDASPDLSKKVPEFHTRQMSRIQSLLRLGAGQNLCFGIQVVDKTLLTELVDINISTPTSLKGVISNVMGTAHEIDLETHYGVIEILPNHQTRKKEIVFNHVVPHWTAQRGNLQIVSWLLRIEVERGLNSGTQGFAGRGSVGDYQDIVGPFDERGLPLRYLLDKIVAQSTGSSWIAQVTGKQAEDLNILKTRSAWMVLEYKRSEAEYAPLLNSVAAGLPATPDTDRSDKRQGDASQRN